MTTMTSSPWTPHSCSRTIDVGQPLQWIVPSRPRHVRWTLPKKAPTRVLYRAITALSSLTALLYATTTASPVASTITQDELDGQLEPAIQVPSDACTLLLTSRWRGDAILSLMWESHQRSTDNGKGQGQGQRHARQVLFKPVQDEQARETRP